MKKHSPWLWLTLLFPVLVVLTTCNANKDNTMVNPVPETSITWVGTVEFSYIDNNEVVTGINFVMRFEAGDKAGKVDLDATITGLDEQFVDQEGLQIDVEAGKQYRMEVEVALSSGVKVETSTTCFLVFFDSPSATQSQLIQVNNYTSNQGEKYCFDPSEITSVVVTEE